MQHQCRSAALALLLLALGAAALAQNYDPQRQWREQERRQKAERDERDAFYRKQVEAARETSEARMRKIDGSFKGLYDAIASYEAARDAENPFKPMAPMSQAEKEGRQRDHIRQLAASGQVNAMAHLGHALLTGSGLWANHRNPKEGIEWLTRAGNAGEKVSMTWLVGWYQGRSGGTPDRDQQAFWARKAVAAGMPEYASELAEALLDDGVLLPKDAAKRAELRTVLPLAAQSGSHGAQIALAQALLEGGLVERNPKEAERLLIGLADKRPYAAFELAWLYFEGAPGVPVDKAKARTLWIDAAERGNRVARAEYVEHALNKDAGLGVDVERSLRFAESLLADASYPKVDKAYLATLVAHCFSAQHSKCGRPADPEKHFAWMRRAADHGGLQGRWETALAYGRGQGVARSDAEALRRFVAMAQEGSPIAMHQVYVYLMDGRGAAQNVPLAVDFLMMAASRGHLDSAKEVLRQWQAITTVPSPNNLPRWNEQAARQAVDFALAEDKRDPMRFFKEAWHK